MHNVVLYLTMAIIATFIIISKTFSPIWLIVVAVVMLYPYRKEKNARPIFLLCILLFILYIIFHYFALLIPFIIGIGLAYILTPLVDILERKHIPRPIAILSILLPLVAIFPLLIFLIVSGLITEVQVLIDKLPGLFQKLQTFSSNLIARLVQFGVSIDPNFLTQQLTNLIGGVFKTIAQIGRTITGIIAVLYNIIIIPLTTYLVLADREKFSRYIKALFNPKEQNQISEFLERLNYAMARFFRGQIILVICVGVIVGFFLWLLGIKYYLLLGIIAGVCNFIPNIGYIISFIPALLIGLTSPDPLITVLKIVAVYVGEQLIENFYLGPVIIGKASRLHPIIVMIALILGGVVYGFWGLVLAIPVVIFIREFINYFVRFNPTDTEIKIDL